MQKLFEGRWRRGNFRKKPRESETNRESRLLAVTTLMLGVETRLNVLASRRAWCCLGVKLDKGEET